MAVVDGVFLVIALLVGGFVFHLGLMIADVGATDSISSGTEVS